MVSQNVLTKNVGGPLWDPDFGGENNGWTPWKYSGRRRSPKVKLLTRPYIHENTPSLPWKYTGHKSSYTKMGKWVLCISRRENGSSVYQGGKMDPLYIKAGKWILYTSRRKMDPLYIKAENGSSIHQGGKMDPLYILENGSSSKTRGVISRISV